MLRWQGLFQLYPGPLNPIFALESSPGAPKFPLPETVAVAQLVEPLIVVQVVAGSSPVGRPTLRLHLCGQGRIRRIRYVSSIPGLKGRAPSHTEGRPLTSIWES